MCTNVSALQEHNIYTQPLIYGYRAPDRQQFMTIFSEKSQLYAQERQQQSEQQEAHTLACGRLRFAKQQVEEIINMQFREKLPLWFSEHRLHRFKVTEVTLLQESNLAPLQSISRP